MAWKRCMGGILAGAVLVSSLIGCQNTNHTTRGAAVGSGLGALTGAIVGHQTGHKAEGALIGAAAGALGGGLLGNAKDSQEEAEAWASYANHQERVRQAQQTAVAAEDIVQMTQAGLSDEIIIQSIQNRGIKFDSSPRHLMFLKQSGVSERVISAVQQHTRR